MAVLTLGVALRLAWLVWGDGFDPRARWRHDGSWYDAVARGFGADGVLLEPDGQPASAFPPGYPALLGLVYAILGDALLNAKLLNTALGTLSCLLSYGIGTRAYGRSVGVTAATLLALWPSEIFFTGATISEPTFSFVLSAALYSFLAWGDARRGRWLRWVAFGGLLGLAVLVRGAALLLPAVPVAVWFLVLGPGGRASSRGILTLLGFALVLGAWSVRNVVVLGYPVLLSTGSSYTLLAAHSPVADGYVPRRLNEFREREFAKELAAPDAKTRVYWAETRYALRYVVEHPWKELQLVPWRLLHFYKDDQYAFNLTVLPAGQLCLGERRWVGGCAWRSLLRWWSDVWFYFFGALGLVGLLRASSPSTGPAFVVPMTVVYFNVLHAFLFYGEPRYHAPLIPLLAVLAAVAIDGRVRPWRLTQPHSRNPDPTP